MVRRSAPAKVNLLLAVGPAEPPGAPRAGWHPILSWIHAIDLADDVAVEPLGPDDGITLDVRWAPDAPQPSPIDWPAERDLAHRAHAALEAHVARPLPARLTITKRIPVGAGLGGGSSDAAATLLALCAAFDLRLAIADLARLAAPLGSDIAFFLDDPAHHPPRPAIVSGFGDRIERVERTHGEFTLVCPPFGCDTRAVYRALDDLRPVATLDGAREQADRARREWSARRPPALRNDLAAPARAHQPRLAALIDALDRADLAPHVTGSGSTLIVRAAPDRIARVIRDARTLDPIVRERTALIPARLA